MIPQLSKTKIRIKNYLEKIVINNTPPLEEKNQSLGTDRIARTKTKKI